MDDLEERNGFRARLCTVFKVADDQIRPDASVPEMRRALYQSGVRSGMRDMLLLYTGALGLMSIFYAAAAVPKHRDVGEWFEYAVILAMSGGGAIGSAYAARMAHWDSRRFPHDLLQRRSPEKVSSGLAV
ncbi:MAG: hypothetical protein H6865_06240 [Rhodospirillales bacterium]|nr:hypothetical protein [Rhodospirillales bacterium]USO07917.1 MAG: hypothetical protein H6866_01460 [Rhodospirillales bacterium]